MTTIPNKRKKKPRTKLLAAGMQADRVPEDSRRKAAWVLEVLAGIRTPEQAAEGLGVSVPTYYNLETRALRGLVHGCTPESPGRKAALEKVIRDANARCKELEHEVQRYRALLRTTQRAADMLIKDDPPATKRRVTAGKGRSARKPRVRALRAIEALQIDRSSDSMSTTSNGAESSK